MTGSGRRNRKQKVVELKIAEMFKRTVFKAKCPEV